MIIGAVGAPYVRGFLAAADPAANKPSRKVADVIGMEMPDKDLVYQIVGNLN